MTIVLASIGFGGVAKTVFKKAPRDKQYLIDSIYYSNRDAIAGELLVIDQRVEESPASLGTLHNVIGIFDLGVLGSTQQIMLNGLKTKYMTIRPRSVSDLPVGTVIIFGDLIPLSKVDAIWEFIRKGR